VDAKRDAGTMIVWILGVLALALIAVSITLTLTGASDNWRNWTGAIGGVLLFMWAWATVGNKRTTERDK
jgi:hypothetical protein